MSVGPYHPKPHLRITPEPRLRTHDQEAATPKEVGWSIPRPVGTLGGVEVDVELIPAVASYPIRHAVLRPHQSIEQVPFKEDDEPGTATFGAVERADGAVVGVATVFRDPAPFDAAEAGVPSGAGSNASTWRLRGMATRSDAQGQGIGTLVLNAVFDHVAAEGGDLLWCNARVSAIAFYERAGFRTWGEQWVIPAHGPHVVMWRRIEPGRV